MDLARGTHHLLRASALLAAALGFSALAQPQQPGFEEVAPILEEHCTLCHSGDGAPLGLRLDSREAVLEGSDRGAVVVEGDPEASELVRRLRGTSQPRMPLTGPPYLDEATIEVIVAWIEAGAPAGPSAAEAEGGGAEGGGAEGGGAASSPAPGGLEDVLPVLQQRCASCHSVDGVMGAPPEGLVLTSYETILAGGERTVVVPGEPLASELYRRIVGLSLPRMPFDGPPFLDEDTIDRIRQWIEAGAPGRDGRPADVRVGAEVRLQGTLTGRWELDGFPLQVSPETRIDDQPGVGSFVEVRGELTPDGGVRATRIRVR